ncbi:hypothetical protein DFP72DRAFT_1180480 [Ephemerocybe angulata]|uniref:Uncharacterized protein n=1 Tax=Ephemerocybe angulata TaxID=980116 RepID=A0A8H6H6W4_9AGAR|nr:hypothetical protein DFP72DRAFT_1180480 [Tulosesus angulatus]
MSRTYSPTRPNVRFPISNALEYLEQLPTRHIGALVLVLHRQNTGILAKTGDRLQEARKDECRAQLNLLEKLSRALVTAHILEGGGDRESHRVQEESEAAELKYCLALRRWKESRKMVADIRAHMYDLGEREMEDAFYTRVLNIEREYGILYQENDDVTGPGPSLDRSDDEDWSPASEDGSSIHDQDCSEDEEDEDDGDDGADAQAIVRMVSRLRADTI